MKLRSVSVLALAVLVAVAILWIGGHDWSRAPLHASKPPARLEHPLPIAGASTFRTPREDANSAASAGRLSPVVQSLSGRLSGKISVEELAAIEILYTDLVARREALELSIAQREVIKKGSVLVSIPDYKVQGQKMLDDFVDDVCRQIEKSKGSEIVTELTRSVQADNAFFGAKAQQILIERKGDVFHVVHEVGGFTIIPGSPLIFTRTTISELLPQQLGRYAFMGNLFPKDG